VGGRLLVYGFSGFGRLEANPAEEIARALAGPPAGLPGASLLVLPVRFDAFRFLIASVEELRPDLVVGIGCSNRPRVAVEAQAVNVLDSTEADITGRVERGGVVDPEGPPAIATSFDAEGLVERLRAHDLPCELSRSAGTFICNQTYYRLLDHLRRTESPAQAVFVHVPLSPREVNRLDMSLASFPPALIAGALRSCLPDLLTPRSSPRVV
jgi:pyroglutamyl-peptidase